jgi:hypothetical protein
MFNNIKKASEYSLLNEKLVHIVTGKPKPGEAPSEALTQAEKAKKDLEALHSDVFYTLFIEEKKVMKMLQEGDAYNGDWEKLNEKFYDLMGVDKKKGERYLTETQKQVFKELELEGDTFAKVDGKLGPYTLYALALSFGLKMPKIRIPAGSPRLVALINKNADEAFGFYEKLRLAKKVNKREFKKAYKDIITTSAFDPEKAKLGDWALALWKAGYRGHKPEKIGFPKLYAIDSEKYPYAYGKMELVILAEGLSPIFVDKKGKMFKEMYDELEPYTYEAEAPKGEEKKKKAPKSKPELGGKPQEYITNAERGFGVRHFYRYPNGTFMNKKSEVVEAKDVVPLIVRHEALTPDGKKVLGVDIANDEVAYYHYPSFKLYGIAKERRPKAPEKPKKSAPAKEPEPKAPPTPTPPKHEEPPVAPDITPERLIEIAATPPAPPVPEKMRDLIAERMFVLGDDGKPNYQGDYYFRLKDGSYLNSKFKKVKASKVLPLIASKTYKKPTGEKFYVVNEEKGRAYYDETGKLLQGRPGDSVLVQKRASKRLRTTGHPSIREDMA